MRRRLCKSALPVCHTVLLVPAQLLRGLRVSTVEEAGMCPGSSIAPCLHSTCESMQTHTHVQHWSPTPSKQLYAYCGAYVLLAKLRVTCKFSLTAT